MIDLHKVLPPKELSDAQQAGWQHCEVARWSPASRPPCRFLSRRKHILDLRGPESVARRKLLHLGSVPLRRFAAKIAREIRQ